MITLKIIDEDKGSIACYEVSDYKFVANSRKVFLCFSTKKGYIAFKILADDREKKITSIVDYINKQLELADKGEQSFAIRKFFAREYLYIGEDDERQFTGREISKDEFDKFE